MNIIENPETIDQRSDAWHALRIGKVTASRIKDVMAKTKTGYGASRKNYMAELLVERMTGQKADSYINSAMQHGIDTEAEARAAYEVEKFVAVAECGFFIAPEIPMSGASPDGLVDADGLVEIKCPNTATHIDTLLSGTIDDGYIKQMQWQMYCTMRSYCDFVSYDNRMPEHLRLFVKRVERDDKMIEEIKTEVVKFLSELEDMIKALEAVNPAE